MCTVLSSVANVGPDAVATTRCLSYTEALVPNAGPCTHGPPSVNAPSSTIPTGTIYEDAAADDDVQGSARDQRFQSCPTPGISKV